MEFIIALVLVGIVFLAISARLASMTEKLDKRQGELKQIRAEAAGQKAVLLDALKGATPKQSAVLWDRYHKIDYEQAQAEVEYVLRYGEKEDHWNYEANKHAALKHQYEASQWITHPAPRDNSPREGMI